MESDLIIKTLNALKHKLKQSNVIEIQQEKGFITEGTFLFNQGANIEEVEAFIRQTGWVIPSDFKQFLLLHNGSTLFKHPNYGGGTEILSLKQIISHHEGALNIPDEWYPIAYKDASYICIDSDRVENGRKDYLFWLDSITKPKDALDLKLNFEIWLDRLIVSQGSEFWLWPIYDVNFGSK